MDEEQQGFVLHNLLLTKNAVERAQLHSLAEEYEDACTACRSAIATLQDAINTIKSER